MFMTEKKKTTYYLDRYKLYIQLAIAVATTYPQVTANLSTRQLW